MDPVYATLLQSVCALFLAETGRIACQCFGQFTLRNDRIDEFTDHGMLTCSDQVQIFSLDLIHHGIHLGKAHNAGHHIAADHERRYTISKASAYHEISCIRDHS